MIWRRGGIDRRLTEDRPNRDRKGEAWVDIGAEKGEGRIRKGRQKSPDRARLQFAIPIAIPKPSIADSSYIMVDAEPSSIPPTSTRWTPPPPIFRYPSLPTVVEGKKVESLKVGSGGGRGGHEREIGRGWKQESGVYKRPQTKSQLEQRARIEREWKAQPERDAYVDAALKIPPTPSSRASPSPLSKSPPTGLTQPKTKPPPQIKERPKTTLKEAGFNLWDEDYARQEEAQELARTERERMIAAGKAYARRGRPAGYYAEEDARLERLEKEGGQRRKLAFLFLLG